MPPVCEYCLVVHTDEPCFLCGHLHLHERCKMTPEGIRDAYAANRCSCCCYITRETAETKEAFWIPRMTKKSKTGCQSYKEKEARRKVVLCALSWLLQNHPEQIKESRY